MANEVPSINTLIQVRATGASPYTYLTIENLNDIDGPNVSMNVNDTTSHSTTGGYAGKSPGLIDAGEISFPMFYNAALIPTHSETSPNGLGYMFLNRQKRIFRIVAPDPSATTRYFTGFVSNYSETHSVRGIDTKDVTISIDGPISTVEPA
jgi:hypothetical protein